MPLEKICIVASAPLTIKAFMLNHLVAMNSKYHVAVVANADDFYFLRKLGVDADTFSIGIERRISPWNDLVALARLVRLFRAQRFDLVHSVTPKAGLLAMLAGFLARVPVRVHIFTGQVWVTGVGWRRLFLKTLDRLLAACATHVLVDSASQRNFLLGEGIVSDKKSRVLANGSICGVDTRRFAPNPTVRASIRDAAKIPQQDIVFLYLGRLNQDKGVLDLGRAFSLFCRENNRIHLMIVGPDEDGMQEQISRTCHACSDRLHFIGYTDVPEQYMAAADVFCLPSYREGFGSSIIEAASVGIPAIGSRIYGITDAIADGVSGLLHEPGDIEGLLGCMRSLAEDRELRENMGQQARLRAHGMFSSETVTVALLGFYDTVLDQEP